MGQRQFLSLSLVMLMVVNLFACTSPDISPTPVPPSSPTPQPSPTASPTPSPIEPAEEAFRLLRQSDFEDALAAYQRAIEIDESYGPAYSGISYIYILQNDQDELVLEQAEKGIELAPESAFAQAILARAQMKTYFNSQAINSAQKAVELEPKNPFAQATLAKAYLINFQYEQARLAAEEAYRLDPQSTDALAALGLYYAATADFTRAGVAFQRAAELEPEYAIWQIALGDLWRNCAKYDQAASAYQKALELAPNHLDALLGLAYVGMDRYDFATAETWLDEAGELSQESAEVKIARGYLYLDQTKFKEALNQFKQALELNPRSYRANIAIANTYLQQDECEQSKRQVHETASTFPDTPDMDVILGYSEVCTGNVTKALSHFRDATKADPYSAFAQIGLGTAYAIQERWKDSTNAFLEALRLNPAPGNIHAEMGDVFDLQGLAEDAQGEYRITLSLDPYLPDVYSNLGFYDYIESKLVEAREMVEKALQLDPNNIQARRILAIILIDQNDASQAILLLEEALEEDPEDTFSHLLLGLAHREQGNYRQALKEVETYKALAGTYISEEDVFLVNYLAYALDTGYLLSTEKAFSDFENIYQEIRNENLKVHMEELDGGRTLVASVPVSQADVESGAFVEPLSLIFSLASLYAPRLDPPVDNGLLVRFTQGGKPVFTGSVPLTPLKKYADTLLTIGDLFDYLEILVLEENNSSASITKIFQELAEIRELDLQAAIPVETISQDMLQASLEGSVDEQVRESMRQDAEVLTLLGAISPNLNLEETWVNLYGEQVGGYYDTEEEKIFLVEEDGGTDFDQTILAHEVAHALQDQHFDLDMLGNPGLNDDQQLALNALIEGDALLVGTMYTQEHILLLDQLDSATQASGLESEEMESAPFFISELLIFPYLGGLEFVNALYERDGWEGVNQAYSALPQSSEQILHPERYFDGEEPVDVSLPEIDPQTGWQEVDRNVLGELGLRLALTEHLGPMAANAAAEGWGGDEYLLLENPQGDQIALLLRTVWDSFEEAEQFWQLFQEYLDHRPGFREVVHELVGEPDWRQWASEANSAYIRLDDKTVDVILGQDASAAQALMDILK